MQTDTAYRRKYIHYDLFHYIFNGHFSIIILSSLSTDGTLPTSIAINISYQENFRISLLMSTSNSMGVGVGTLFRSYCKVLVNRRVEPLHCCWCLFLDCCRVVSMAAVTLSKWKLLNLSYLMVSYIWLPVIKCFLWYAQLFWFALGAWVGKSFPG